MEATGGSVSWHQVGLGEKAKFHASYGEVSRIRVKIAHYDSFLHVSWSYGDVNSVKPGETFAAYSLVAFVGVFSTFGPIHTV